MTKTKLYIILFTLICLTIFLGTIYRPYIYKNNIDDYGLADVGYNIIAVVNISICSWIGIFKLTKNKISDILITTCFFLLYELLSYFIDWFGTFDLMDCFAIVISGILSLILLFIIDKKTFKNNLTSFKT